MIQEDKDLLLKDLYVRLPYGVKVLVKDSNGREYNFKLSSAEIFLLEKVNTNIKPYLRSMASMTEEELHEASSIIGKQIELRDDYINIIDSSLKHLSYKELKALFDWFNAHHFDYCGLIEKGLASEAPEGMYNLK